MDIMGLRTSGYMHRGDISELHFDVAAFFFIILRKIMKKNIFTKRYGISNFEFIF